MIADLDELVRSCRSSRARNYVAEAVLSYKAGAFRSTIVATWIAVVFDYMDKLLELTASGDNQARAEVEKLQGFHGKLDSASIKASQKFEFSLLDDAKDIFGLLTPIQHADLQRLRDDRNRCAHPSVQDDDTPYLPSAELARYHLRCAIEYMLSQPPVQGKAALDQLMSEVASEFFPERDEDVLIRFKAGPLGRAKTSLVRNFCIRLLKLVLVDEVQHAHRLRGIGALRVLHQMYPGIVEAALADRLPDIVELVPDRKMGRVMWLLRHVSESREALTEANVARIRPYLRSEAAEKPVAVVRVAMNIPVTRDIAVSLIPELTDDDLGKLITAQPFDEALAEAVARYAKSSNYETANRHGKALILPHLTDLGFRHAGSIRQAILGNDQLIGSSVGPKVVQGLTQLLSDDDEGEKAAWFEFYRELRASEHASRDYGIATSLEERFPELTEMEQQ